MANDTGYVSPYAEQLKEIYDRLQKRGSFRYSAASDPTYRQYETAYRSLGNTAMRDTSGQAADLTGGYGSTYSRSAGEQAYEKQLQALYAKIPELQSNALAEWKAEGDDLNDLLTQLRALDDDAYNRYLTQYKASSGSSGTGSTAKTTAATPASGTLANSLIGLNLLSETATPTGTNALAKRRKTAVSK